MEKKLWFRAKTYGWGWTPSSWEGWLVTVLYILLVLACFLTLDQNSPTREVMFMGVLPLMLLTIAFIRIAYRKGEKPSWRWGKKEN